MEEEANIVPGPALLELTDPIGLQISISNAQLGGKVDTTTLIGRMPQSTQ